MCLWIFVFLVCHSRSADFNLVWSDDFYQPLGSGPSSSKWVYDLGVQHQNEELEYYTNSRKNSFVIKDKDCEDGKALVIRGLRETIHTGNVTTNYTSARIKTQGIYDFRYGKIECRAKIPKGPGIWPAFWTLGANIDKIGWPDCGEIDVMEGIDNMSTIYGTVHGPGDTGVGVGGNITMKPFNTSDWSQAFHVFSAIWAPKKISFFVDSIMYFTVTQKMIGKMWAFNAPQFLILNLAIGGGWPGFPNENTTFPADYIIDYVRVWQ